MESSNLSSKQLLEQLNELSTKRSNAEAADQHLPMSESDISRIIEMAWEDRTPFEAIEQQFKLVESHVIELMRQHLKPSSFKLWRKRVSGRATKHQKLRPDDVNRAYCPTQYKHR